MPLFVIENANNADWIRELATLIHIKDVRRSGYFVVDKSLSKDVNSSVSTIYKHLTILLDKGLVEKEHFKNGYVYRCVSIKTYHKLFNRKKGESFINKVPVEKKNKQVTHTKNHLLLKILEQKKNHQEYRGFKNRTVNQERCKSFLKLTKDGNGWFNRAYNNSVIFDDRGIATFLGVSKSKANSLKHYLRKNNFINISLLYKEVVPECNNNSYLLYNGYYKEISKDIPHVTFINNKIVYVIGTEYKFKTDYTRLNGSCCK